MVKKTKLKEKIKDLKEKVKRKRKKVYGDPKITGVTRPKKKPAHSDSSAASRQNEKDQPVVVGPRGGKYKEGPGGKKQYKKREAPIRKSEVLDMIQEVKKEGDFKSFVEKFKKSGKNE